MANWANEYCVFWLIHPNMLTVICTRSGSMLQCFCKCILSWIVFLMVLFQISILSLVAKIQWLQWDFVVVRQSLLAFTSIFSVIVCAGWSWGPFDNCDDAQISSSAMIWNMAPPGTLCGEQAIGKNELSMHWGSYYDPNIHINYKYSLTYIF